MRVWRNQNWPRSTQGQSFLATRFTFDKDDDEYSPGSSSDEVSAGDSSNEFALLSHSPEARMYREYKRESLPVNDANCDQVCESYLSHFDPERRM
eukprot:IDg7820t1